jgi:RNA polymerase sigma factor (sigma-70 family)
VNLQPRGRIGSYELESAIGEGGLGDVWKAHDISTGRLVALRILPAPPPRDPSRFARFDDDIRKLISLRHPNVAQVYELVDSGDVRALACEWVAGNSLAKLIATCPIPVDEAIGIAAQVANGLAAVHARDLVHGDIKPSNVALCSDGTVKVLDVGLVEIYDLGDLMPRSDIRPAPSARLLGAITGTAAYMSPEQIAGHAADSRTDVWAFGCVVYEMLTNTPAFAADDVTDTMARVTIGEPEWTLIPPAVPASLVQMLRHCLEKDPLRRFQRLTDVGPIRATIGDEEAAELPGAIWSELKKQIPELRRWAHGHLPPGSELDTSDVVQEALLSAAKRLKGLELKSRPALSAYLRSAVQNRIRDEVRRRRRLTQTDPGVERDRSDMSVRYREALKHSKERERTLIESRLQDRHTYDEIATRFLFPSADAARMAVTRALRRLADWISRKKRD